MKRQTYQKGSVVQDSRRGIWVFRWREDGKRKSESLGRCRNKAEAQRKAAPLVLAINDGEKRAGQGMTVGELVTEYMTSDRFPARFSTRAAYTYNFDNHILPKWGETCITKLTAYEVETWLKSLGLSAKSKVHLRGLLRISMEFAMHLGYLSMNRNPMELVRIPGASKRAVEPRILTVEEFQAFLAHVESEPYRTMILTAMCLGLRVSELLGLQWGDIDWQNSRIKIQRGIVRNRVDDVKTRYSGKSLPLDPDLGELLKMRRVQTEFKESNDWVWASPAMAGKKPLFYTTLEKVLGRAATKAGLEGIGWHSFRHSFRSWVAETGAEVGVQQKLMRHSDIRTTMNIYGDALPETLRTASSKVVKMALRTA